MMETKNYLLGILAMPEYSISQMGTFEECPLQYRLIYVDRIKRYEEGVEDRIKAFVSTEKRYTVMLKEDSLFLPDKVG